MARTKATPQNSPMMGRHLRTRNRALPPPPPPPSAPSSTTRVLRSETAKAAAAAAASNAPKRKLRPRADPWTPKHKAVRKSKPKPRAPPPTHFTCRICVEEQTADQFTKWIPSPQRHWGKNTDVPVGCIAHLARNPSKKSIKPVCKTCIGNTMSARLDMLGARQVREGCLEPECKITWPHDLIMQYMPKGEPLEKYNMEMFEVWKQDTYPKPLACLSPTCGAVGLPDPSAHGYPQVVCNDCSLRSCAQCLVPWHKDVTCAEYTAQHVDEHMTDPEKETLKFMQTKDGKRCPNCQLVVEKDGGCNSMYCVGCQKYFDWSAAASAVSGAKKPEIPYISNAPYRTQSMFAPCEADSRPVNATGVGAAPAVAAAS